jgi:ABC-type antimicrobial peptide transport system permease subunit
MPLRFHVYAREREPSDRSADLRRAIAQVDPAMPWTRVSRASELVDDQAAANTTLALAINTMGAMALSLAAAGIFAVMAYTVSRRTREMGIRMALGASASDVMRLVLAQSLRLTTVGAIVGLTLAAPLAFALRALLLGVSPLDPLALGSVVALLAATAMAAALLPARRAAAVDPVATLRTE